MRRALLLSLLIAAPVFAQSEKPKETKKKPVTTLIFGDGTEIEATPDSPNATVIDVAPTPRFGSMIKVRENFSDKLLDSVYEL